MASKATILVIDDDASVRFFLAIMLKHAGYQVTTADGGEAALECIAAQELDLALIDLKMEGIGGLEVLATLRQQSPDTVAIVLTAHSSFETAVEALHQGTHDHLSKPCKMDEILECVRAGLLRHQRELQKRAQVKFASDVSHQLCTPLTGISLRLDLLERDKPERRTRHLNILKQEIDQMASLTESVLTLSRLEAGEVKMGFTPEDLNALVAQVVAARQAHAKTVGLELIFEPGAALPPVRVACNQLTQMVDNLVANAINYTPAGQVQVSTRLAAERGQACLQVQDTGMGIEPENLPHLFRRFYRGLRVSQSDIPGTGLGLAIVKEIVDLQGGEMESRAR